MAAPKIIPTSIMRTVRRGWTAPFLDWLDALLASFGFGAPQFEVDVAVTAVLPGAVVYANGTLGVGATITGGDNNSIGTIDGKAAAVGLLYLVTAQAAGAQNGLYALTQDGDAASVPFILTRVAYFDQSAEIKDGSEFFVRFGTVSANTKWVYTGGDAPTVGTTALTFQRGAGGVTLNTAQTITGAKKFTTLLLQVLNGAGTFVSKFTSSATADRTVTLPDVDLTVAQAAVASGSTTPGAGGGTAPAFTGTAATAAENIAAPVFSGTGQSSAGQVITTTDNQTMTLNQCAGMWFISATHGPYLIASNTAVVGAPAVLTTYGTAPTTDAGTYKIVSGMTPVGTVASHTHTGAAHTHTQT